MSNVKPIRIEDTLVRKMYQGDDLVYDASNNPAGLPVKRTYLGDTLIWGSYSVITFADASVEAICVANFDTDNDGKLSYDEAAAVTDLYNIFYKVNNNITSSFNELQYFTGLSSIGSNAFLGSGLTSVTIPDGVTSIGYMAFAWCVNLTSVVIPNSVTSIGNYAFSSCRGMTSLTIGNSVESIGESAFSGCHGLTSITIPASVTSIGGDAFDNCSGLISITVENGNSKYDSRNNCNAIIDTSTNTLIVGCRNTTIPNSVTSIGSDAFESGNSPTSITIPSSVTSIGSYAFQYSGLTSINIAAGITEIGKRAFYSCSSLVTVEINTQTPPSLETEVFVNCSSLQHIYVPSSAVSTYKSASGWSDYASIIEAIPE